MVSDTTGVEWPPLHHSQNQLAGYEVTSNTFAINHSSALQEWKAVFFVRTIRTFGQQKSVACGGSVKLPLL